MAMQVTVKGKNVDVPERVKDQATRKLTKISRFDDRILTMDVEFSEERNPRVSDQHKVEVTVTTKAHLIRAEASGSDPATSSAIGADSRTCPPCAAAITRAARLTAVP